MLRRLLIRLVCAASLVSSAGLAQPASTAAEKDTPSTAVAPVTVQAAPTAKVIARQTTRFVEAHAAAANPNVDQIGRWRGPVCVRVWGLPRAEQAAKIKARVEGMAEAIGLPAPRADCKVNTEIVFSDQAQSLMDAIARRWEPLLGYYHLSNAKVLKKLTHPIQAWYVTGTDGDGVDLGALMFSGLPRSLMSPAPDVIDDPTNTPPAGCADRATACYKSVFHNVLIVADSKALVGKPLGLVADDIVMLALSQAKSMEGCNALPSVMDAFANSSPCGRDPPRGLTVADAAYLSALYSADLSGRKRFEQSDIAERMAAILVKAGAGDAIHGATPADTRTR